MQVTNDGATILKAIGVDNPAAKILVGEFRLPNMFHLKQTFYYVNIVF
jgi:hypothetical protein